MVWSDYLVFVDESGDHSMDPINVDYPIFVLSQHYLRVAFYLSGSSASRTEDACLPQ